MTDGQPKINFEKAVEIAQQSFIPSADLFTVYEKKQDWMNIYLPNDEPCWFIKAPWNDKLDYRMITSQHVIVISKESGEIIYDGSACDEG